MRTPVGICRVYFVMPALELVDVKWVQLTRCVTALCFDLLDTSHMRFYGARLLWINIISCAWICLYWNRVLCKMSPPKVSLRSLATFWQWQVRLVQLHANTCTRAMRLLQNSCSQICTRCSIRQRAHHSRHVHHVVIIELQHKFKLRRMLWRPEMFDKSCHLFG